MDLMATGLFQLVVTVWMSAHPVTYTLPQLYSFSRCLTRAESLGARLKPRKRINMICVQTDKKEA